MPSIPVDHWQHSSPGHDVTKEEQSRLSAETGDWRADSAIEEGGVALAPATPGPWEDAGIHD
jgi:hypothetical protein